MSHFASFKTSMVSMSSKHCISETGCPTGCILCRAPSMRFSSMAFVATWKSPRALDRKHYSGAPIPRKVCSALAPGNLCDSLKSRANGTWEKIGWRTVWPQSKSAPNRFLLPSHMGPTSLQRTWLHNAPQRVPVRHNTGTKWGGFMGCFMMSWVCAESKI